MAAIFERAIGVAGSAPTTTCTGGAIALGSMDVVEHRGTHRFGLGIGTAIAGMSICNIALIVIALGAA